MSAPELIPVSILTGFLGSGKTTLLRQLLRDPALSRTAVIINEFGEIGIDHELVETSDESVVQLTTGCLCCRVASDLAMTLADLARRREAGSIPRFEQVIIETSGLADPAPILHTLMRGTLPPDYVLGTVTTTVDAVNGTSTLAWHEQSQRQAAMADRIVITKTDMPESALRRELARLNPDAPVLTAVRGELPAQALISPLPLDQGAEPIRHRYHHADALHHTHDPGIVSFSLVRSEPLRAATLALFLEALADNCGVNLLRLKGFVHVAERSQGPAVIHGVQHVFHAPQWWDAWPSADRSSRLVFIVKGISETWVHNLLELLEAEVADETARRQF